MSRVSKYQRIFLKLIGEIWQSKELLKEISEEIIEIAKNLSIKIAIVTSGVILFVEW